MADNEESETNDKSAKRKRRSKSRISPSLGGTPFTGQPAYTMLDFNVVFFTTEEYQIFERDLLAVCVAYELVVEQIERVMGIWEGELEPAVAVQLHGKEEDIVAVAIRLGAKYKQYGMLIVIPDQRAAQYSYTIIGISEEDAEDAILAMQHYGVQGGRYAAGRLEIADVDGSWATSILKLAAALRKPLTKVRARVRLLSGDAPGKAEGKDYEWTSER